ncbi:helix-turn-helix transcriptional regulator [Leptolyngbya cf. ectocarpi LEGE 11479]|uniref:Helix-turn-helix transcriptional regulator n=1 Tax=Leptolyngbya cf. ectocarpi LEGE 11479 TaxID=1828722 RepID=A0A928ZST8_LEPEC|nr:AraC family transcriptional regulator [Leptolyngbya ectocarpi]MBE9066807.1 helix-turn-helix transcriptional regulator [Leptolyngbya cf. ectocarpi LEGE 11479]
MRHYDLDLQPKDEMPCLGNRFETDQITLDLNTADPFSVNFACPGQVFSLQLGPRHYSIALNSDRLQKRQLTAGSITFSPKNTTVKSQTGKINSEFLAFSIKDALFVEAMDAANCSETQIRPIYDFHHPDNAALGSLLRRFILQPAGRSQLYAETLCTLLLHNLMVGLYNQYEDIPSQLSSPSIKLVCDYIEENLAQNISLKELACLANMDQYRFSRSFKAKMGVSPYAYVLERRIASARKLIENSQLSLAEIAYDTGFSSQSHMTTTFKKRLGITPGVLR